MTKALDVFISYSHADESFRKELENHLSLLRRSGVIEQWHDRMISAGTNWKAAIDTNLDKADVVLLLVSSDFLASDYCHEIEMKRALARHEEGIALVIPIIIRACDWQGAAFGHLQALPKDAQAVKTWPDQDQAWADVAKGIRTAIAVHQNP